MVMILKEAGKLDGFMKFIKGMSGKASTLGKQTGEMSTAMYNTAKGTALGKRIGQATGEIGSKSGWNLYGKTLKGQGQRFARNAKPGTRKHEVGQMWNTMKHNPYKTTAVGAGAIGVGVTANGIGKMIRGNRQESVR